MGRSKLKTLKETTLNTFYEVCKIQGLIINQHYVVNNINGVIKFFNGSEVLMKDLFSYPSDPNFDELGSLEITGAFVDECNQISELAWSVVKSRIRYKLDEYKLIPKILGTCNPSKGWIYTNYYLPERNKTISKEKKFLQALVTDNPFVSRFYIDNLKALPKNLRDRLLLGKWEVSDVNDLCDYDNIVNLFTNSFVLGGDYYITADIARMGADKAVILLWSGLIIKEYYEFDKSKTTDIQNAITTLRMKYKIPLSRIIADEDGVGGGVVDSLRIKGFVNNSKALGNENYQNLKTQCYYKLAECINKAEIYIEAEISTEQRERIISELEQIKADNTDSSDSKLKIISKAQIKQNIGHSPDISDAIAMRMYFLINPYNGKYSIL